MSTFDSGVLGYVEILPTEEIETPIGVGRGRADIGAADDLQSVLGEDLVGHGMADVFSDANNVALEFGGGGGEIRIVQLVVNFFPEVEAEERTDVRCGTSEALHGDGSHVGF